MKRITLTALVAFGLAACSGGSTEAEKPAEKATEAKADDHDDEKGDDEADEAEGDDDDAEGEAEGDDAEGGDDEAEAKAETKTEAKATSSGDGTGKMARPGTDAGDAGTTEAAGPGKKMTRPTATGSGNKMARPK